MTSSVRGAIYGLLAAAIWGGMYVVADIVLEVIPPFTLLTMRLILGILTLGIFVWWMKRQNQHGMSLKRPQGADLLKLLGVGLLGYGISVGVQFVGTAKSTAVNGALVTSASPAFILIFAALILREKLTLQRILAVVLATVGVIIIIDPSKTDFSSDTFIGNLLLAGAAVTWGLFSVLIRRISARFDTMIVTIVGLLGGLILTFPAALIELSQKSIGKVDNITILGILYLGIVAMAGAMWLWNRSLALVDASIVSLFFFAQPLTGAVLSVIILHQEITSALLVGGLFIAAGVLLSIYPLEKLLQRGQLQPQK